MAKKKVLFHSNYCGAPTGFGGFMREIMSYLYLTGKYELYLYASGMTWENPDFQRWPWKIYGTLPNDQLELQRLNQDPNQMRMASYGSLYIDRVIDIVKPDIYCMVEDFWAGDYSIDKPWFDKINSVIIWTSDSLPLLETAVSKAPKIKYHYVWADFARKEFHRLGFKNVGLLRGTVNTKIYKKLSNQEKSELRRKHNIPHDAFCVGSLSRNQLRKAWPNSLEGYKLFRKNNPEIKNCRYLFFTSLREGWNIPRLVKELDIDSNEILCCYKCRATSEYFVMPFQGEEINNPKTGHEKSLITVGIDHPLTVEQINEWYNLLDCFLLPITSGGQERGVQEAKLCEIITLINPYSCGEDNCTPEACSLPLDYSTYREIGTQFIKASPYPQSIAKQLKRVYNMSIKEREEMGKKARQWVLDNFSIEVIGKQYEELLDSLPEVDWSKIDIKPQKRNPEAIVPENPDEDEYILHCYREILKMSIDKSNEGFLYWKNFINQPGQNKETLKKQMVDYMRGVAQKENNDLGYNTVKLEDLLEKTDKKKLLIVLQRSFGDHFLLTSLLPEIYKEYGAEIYIGAEPQYWTVYEGNEFVTKCIPYTPILENEPALIGSGKEKGIFDYYLNPGISCQKIFNYYSSKDNFNGKIS